MATLANRARMRLDELRRKDIAQIPRFHRIAAAYFSVHATGEL